MNIDLLSHALTLFGSDDNNSVRLRGGTVSSVYEFNRDGKPVILRLIPPNAENDLSSMSSILHWTQYLAENGLCVPAPLQSIHDNLVETLMDGDELWRAVTVQKARGIRAETLPFDGWNDHRIMLLGKMAGKLHFLSREYQPPAGIAPRPAWDKVTNNYNPGNELAAQEHEVFERRDEVIRSLEQVPKQPDSYGLIHGDFHCANFFIDTSDDTLTLFDFDDCCYGWYLMDIALPLLDMLVVYPGQDRQAFAGRFLQNFMHGYRSECPLRQEQLRELPTFLKLLEIGLYLQVVDFADKASPDSWVGKFMQGRKENILSGKSFVDLNYSL